jgi:hypothetical protein
MELHLVGDCCSRPLAYMALHICTQSLEFSCQFYFSKKKMIKEILILILLKSQEQFNSGIYLLFRANLSLSLSLSPLSFGYGLIMRLLHGNDLDLHVKKVFVAIRLLHCIGNLRCFQTMINLFNFIVTLSDTGCNLLIAC